MAKLTDVRIRRSWYYELQTPYGDTGLPAPFSSDSSFVLTWIASPPAPCLPEEQLEVIVNDELVGSFPLELLHRLYRGAAAADMMMANELIVHIAKRALLMWEEIDRFPRTADEHAKLQTAMEVTRSLGESISRFSEYAKPYLQAPGVTLGRAILVPPRSYFRLRTTHKSNVRVFLHGTLSMDVS